MAEVYRSVYRTSSAEIEEKKSRFIATVQAVKDKEEAEAFIAACKKKYPDARHNCSAYILGEDGQIEHSSDDGEPAGTAGKPMLEVLRGEKLTNVAAVVTRYFGGILLGTGGLVRAYTQAVKAGLAAGDIIQRVKGGRLSFHVPYTDVGKIQYFIRQNEFILLDTVYEADVKCEVLIPATRLTEFSKGLTEAFSGRIEIEEKKEVLYSVGEDGEVLEMIE
ncbi:MAG: YigZ family protein [Lachnospiraceae bacterium]|jgi:uncharacterized YigZ family protein|nr:YigZ family protein [Lachnospiraceae bacterium]